MGVQLEQLLLHITLCFRSYKNDLNSLRAVSCRPYAFNFARSKLWQIQSKALDKSIATTPTSCFSSRDFLQSSVSFISAVDSKHKINEEIERHKSITRMNANLAQSRCNPFHFHIQNYRSLMLGYQKPGEYLAKTGGQKYSLKTGGFQPKREGWNLHSLV